MNKIQLIFDGAAATLGGIIGFLYGDPTGVFWALLAMMALDYITGVIIAVINKTLSSEIGFKGLAKKFLILIFVAVAHVLDTQVLGGAAVAMTAVMLFYIANEGVSIVENSAALGLPVPEKLIDILEQIKAKSDDNNDGKGE